MADSASSPPAGQLELVRASARRGSRRATRPVAVATELPVARVALLLPLPHLDRPFDYLVTEQQSEAAQPGARVRVRFAGQQVDGFVLERLPGSDFPGQLAKLGRVVSPERVLTPVIARLTRSVADRWAGTQADVLRLAVPARHARAEAAAPAGESPAPAGESPAPARQSAAFSAASIASPGTPPNAPRSEKTPAPPPASSRKASTWSLPPPGAWAHYVGGTSFLRKTFDGGAPRAACTVLPGDDWSFLVARAAQATVAGGRGVLIAVPDGADVQAVSAALDFHLGADSYVALTADVGPERRYRRWLSVLRGGVRVVVGTRAAAYAPVRNLGLVVVWDDGDDGHVEPHAPYAHTRDVLTLRAHQERAGMLIAGHSMTPEAASLVESSWLRRLQPTRATLRARGPRIQVAGEDHEMLRDSAATTARLPSLALRTARAALTRGPVLVQVPRRGYAPVVACQQCRETARCPGCSGALEIAGAGEALSCRWCGSHCRAECRSCGSHQFRAVVVGSERTGEELGRAFPGVPVRQSGGAAVLRSIPAQPALVVATPGAEPHVAGGYAAALLLDGHALLSRPSMRAGEEALRRWLAAATLVRPATQDGQVVVVAPADAPAVQALVRWDPAGFAARELADRRDLGFPPAARVAVLEGERLSVRELLDLARLPESAQVLGPVDVEKPTRSGASDADVLPSLERSTVRCLVRVPRRDGLTLARRLGEAQAVRSARRTAERVRIRIDPHALG